MHQLYVLYETSEGYALLRTREFEEIALFLPAVQSSVLDISKFRGIVYPVAFHAFKNGQDALINFKHITKGVIHADLQLFLENNVPKTQKSKQSVLLGVQDEKLAAAITDSLRIKCSTSGAISEVLRGIRHHYPKLIKGLKDTANLVTAQLGLAHQYCREKFNLKHKDDTMILETVRTIDQLNGDINTLAKRVRECYQYYFPELAKLVPDVISYIQCVKEISNRKVLPPDIEDKLLTILNDKEKVQTVIQASNTTMGMDISEDDIANISDIVERILSLKRRESEMTEYLKGKMQEIAPNMSSVIGDIVGARLIFQARGLLNLAKFPTSTVQVLGAEKSLFRSLKSQSTQFRPINESSLVGQASKESRTIQSKLLASKVTLAARIDCFSPVSSGKPAEKLMNDMNNQMKFYQVTKLKNPEEKRKALQAKRALRRKRKKEKLRLSTAKKSSDDSELLPEDPKTSVDQSSHVVSNKRKLQRNKTTEADVHLNILKKNSTELLANGLNSPRKKKKK